VTRFPGLVTLRCMRALASTAAGRIAEAAREIETLAADSFAALPRDSLYLASMAILSEAAVTCRAVDLARPIVDELFPYASRNLIQGVPVGWGAAAWYIARLQWLLGRRGDAARLLGLVLADLLGAVPDGGAGDLERILAARIPSGPRERVSWTSGPWPATAPPKTPWKAWPWCGPDTSPSRTGSRSGPGLARGPVPAGRGRRIRPDRGRGQRPPGELVTAGTHDVGRPPVALPGPRTRLLPRGSRCRRCWRRSAGSSRAPGRPSSAASNSACLS
jgi:hypothetical protein